MATSVVIHCTEVRRRALRAELRSKTMRDPNDRCHQVRIAIEYDEVTFDCVRITRDDGGVLAGDILASIGNGVIGSGAVVMGAGGVVIVYSWLTGPGTVPTAGAGVTVGLVGAAITGIGGGIKAVGELINWFLAGQATETHERMPQETRDMNRRYVSFVYEQPLELCRDVEGSISADLTKLLYDGHAIPP